MFFSPAFAGAGRPPGDEDRERAFLVRGFPFK